MKKCLEAESVKNIELKKNKKLETTKNRLTLLLQIMT